MKALDKYFLMVVFTLLLNKVRVFANFMSNLSRERWQSKLQALRDPQRQFQSEQERQRAAH